ncbi:MAG TPA: hypothetical protein ACFYD6_02080 [Candidatus Brocadiia bacterium]|nr:hypothetical protein [Planctomycetota bacterium]MDO8094703.1 hypothetical protein [Candidatus Brocadiales bacterium]
MKPIRFSGHAMQQLKPRGCTKEEVIHAIQTQPWQPAELGRLECSEDITYNSEWNRKFYKIKRVRPIFAEETGEIVVVTIYTYYF